MKVLFLCKDFTATNILKQPWAHIHHLMNEFTELGVSSHVISFPPHVAENSEDIDLTFVHQVRGRIGVNIEECARKVMEIGPDILNWYGGLHSSLEIMKLSNMTHSQTVWNITKRRILHGEMDDLGISDIAWNLAELGLVYSYSFLPNYFIRAAAKSVRAIVVPTSKARTSIVNMGVPDNKVHQISSGIDGDLFSRVLPQDEIDEIREGKGFDSDDFVLCYFGPVSNLRGFDTALEAFSKLRTKVANARLLVLARPSSWHPSSWFPDLSAQKTDVKLVSGVLEARTVARFLMASDAIVLPFRFWPVNECPSTILEGMAAGKAVVTTPIGLANDVIVDGANGFVVPPGDSSTLARVLQMLAHDKDRRITVGDSARRLVLSDYDWSCIARKTLELFARVQT